MLFKPAIGCSCCAFFPSICIGLSHNKLIMQIGAKLAKLRQGTASGVVPDTNNLIARFNAITGAPPVAVTHVAQREGWCRR